MVANGCDSSVGKKIMVSVSEEMVKALEQERKARKLETIPEAIRAVLGEYFKTKSAG
jgi:transcriptional regulator of met regulon